ncbi:MAG: hypothetical protein HZY79_12275 [Rhodoblastus sp.]|nr:MAG: hypothetical protein HZY79_12275 [Rhodoblastus sp.]
MRAFLTAAVVLIAIATGSGVLLRSDAQSSSKAFATEGVRLDPAQVANSLGRMPPHVEHK